MPHKISSPLSAPKQNYRAIETVDVNNNATTTHTNSSMAKYLVSSKNTNSETYSFSLKNESLDFNKEKMLTRYKTHVDTTLATIFIQDLTKEIKTVSWFHRNLKPTAEYLQMKDLVNQLKNPTAMKKHEEFFLQTNKPGSNDYIDRLGKHMKEGYNKNIIFEKANAISRMVNMAIDNTVQDLKNKHVSDEKKKIIFDNVMTHFNIDEDTKQKVNPKAASLSSAHHVADSSYNSILTQSKVAKLSNNDPSLMTAQRNVIVPTLGNQIINDIVTKFSDGKKIDLDAIHEYALKMADEVLKPHNPIPDVVSESPKEKRLIGKTI